MFLIKSCNRLLSRLNRKKGIEFNINFNRSPFSRCCSITKKAKHIFFNSYLKELRALAALNYKKERDWFIF